MEKLAWILIRAPGSALARGRATEFMIGSRTMTFETAESVTLKIWDRTAVHHTLDALISELSVRHNTCTSKIAVTASGPNTFTVAVPAS